MSELNQLFNGLDWTPEYDNSEVGRCFIVGPATIYFPYNSDERKSEADAYSKLISQSPAMFELISTMVSQFSDKEELSILEDALYMKGKEILTKIVG